jgi:hypothetical protein
MKLRLLLPLVIATASFARGDNEVGFIERFALAADREKVLTELVPGTEDYYFFHALHYQNTGSTQAGGHPRSVEEALSQFGKAQSH